MLLCIMLIICYPSLEKPHKITAQQGITATKKMYLCDQKDVVFAGKCDQKDVTATKKMLGDVSEQARQRRACEFVGKLAAHLPSGKTAAHFPFGGKK